MASWSAERWGDPAAPVLAVVVHGGFWRARYAADTIAPLAATIGERGVAWAWNIEYPRVGMPGGGWPGTALAVSDAVGAAHQAAGGRPVVLIGHSAGGHLALWAAREHPVTGVIGLAAVCDLEATARAYLGNGALFEFLGEDPGSELYAAADPMHRLPLGVPSLLIHGDEDENVPIGQSRAYAAAAQAAGDECTLRELPGADHFDVIDPDGPAWPVLAGWLGEIGAR